MRFELSDHTITAIRENGDPKFYGVKNAAGESRLLYQIKVLLNNNGFDLIKKRMWKDGHLVDAYQQYLRVRHDRTDTPHVAIFSSFFAIHGAEEEWNKGKVTLSMETDFCYKQPDCVERLRKIAEQSDIINMD